MCKLLANLEKLSSLDNAGFRTAPYTRWVPVTMGTRNIESTLCDS